MAATNPTKVIQSHTEPRETGRIQSPAPHPTAQAAQQVPNRRDSNVIRLAPLARRLLRTREAAAYLSISPWKLRKLVQDGFLPVVQASEGGAWRVDVRDLDSFIERNKRVEPL